MMKPEDRIKAILADLEQDSRTGMHQSPIRVAFEDDAIVLEGTVADIAAKRVARNIGHRHAGNLPVADRLRIPASPPAGAGRLRDEIVHLLQDEPVFNDAGLYVRENGRLSTLRVGQSEWKDPVSGEWAEQRIEIAVEDGTVTLTGTVISLTHRRFAEVLAWWAAGCESVDNRLHVVPPEQETDGELADAVVLVLEKDPLVHHSQLHVSASQGKVTLEGYLASDEERRLAVLDVWYIPGVRDVEDNIRIQE
jgi:osmotically-inducible protein OsmY